MTPALDLPDASDARPGCALCGDDRYDPLFRKKGYALVACRSCRLAYIANPPSSDAIAALYVSDDDYHGALRDPANPEARRMRAIARQHLRFLKRAVAAPHGLKLLDIGCSTGLFLDEARTAGFDVHGTELSPQSGEFARDHFGLPVHVGDWRDAGYPDNSFDVVTLFDVIEHLADPQAELMAIRRLLKPGGILLQSTPDIDGLFPRLSFLLANRLDYWPHPEPPYHLFQFSRRTLSLLTEKAGYTMFRADQTRISLDYSFGKPAAWKISPKSLAYATLFAPTAIIGPWVGMGDWLYLASRPAA